MTKRGRPRKFTGPEEMQEVIDRYFEEKETPTMTGLALSLGFADRRSMYDYERREEFSDTIKRARLRIEMHYEQQLQGPNPTGAIFMLKQFGWDEKNSDPFDGKTEFIVGFCDEDGNWSEDS